MTRSGSGPHAADERIVRIRDRIRAIPEGFVRTYGDIDPAAPRLVGRVLAETEEDLPWHRVVRADGSVAKGATQLRLLRGEGVPLRGKRVDMDQARIPEHFDVERL
jgi:methylated-DNA-protein-cysteine methyltransferase-like protein